MRPSIRTAAAIAVTVVIAGGCSRAGSSSTPPTSSSSSSSSASSSQSATAAASFGSLSNVCHGGNATGSTDQGVTSSQITAGVLTDVGYTKDPELETTAKVFTSWCNAAGGIDGRKLVADIHDTQLLNVVKAMSAACGSDFALAGGSAALDGLGVSTRLKCLLPDFDAQVVMPQNNGAGLQIYPIPWSHTYSVYGGYYNWLINQKYPDSKDHVGILSGASVITQVDDALVAQTVAGVGGKVIYNGNYPITGVTDWTPYAEAIKNKGVKGFTFYGTIQQLAALEQALDNIGYKLDWIDANTNSYGGEFLQVAGKALAEQHNYADLPGVYPLEKAAGNPADRAAHQAVQPVRARPAADPPGRAGLVRVADLRGLGRVLRRRPHPQVRVQGGAQADELGRRRPHGHGQHGRAGRGRAELLQHRAGNPVRLGARPVRPEQRRLPLRDARDQGLGHPPGDPALERRADHQRPEVTRHRPRCSSFSPTRSSA